MLRATTSQPQKVFRGRQFFTLLTSKRASRHNGMQFFISLLARWLCTLASLLFDAPEPQTIGEKHSVSQLFYLFAPLHLLSSGSFSSLIFALLLFSSLTLPASAFSSVHIVGRLASKLPSILCVCVCVHNLRQTGGG